MLCFYPQIETLRLLVWPHKIAKKSLCRTVPLFPSGDRNSTKTKFVSFPLKWQTALIITTSTIIFFWGNWNFFFFFSVSFVNTFFNCCVFLLYDIGITGKPKRNTCRFHKKQTLLTIQSYRKIQVSFFELAPYYCRIFVSKV